MAYQLWASPSPPKLQEALLEPDLTRLLWPAAQETFLSSREPLQSEGGLHLQGCAEEDRRGFVTKLLQVVPRAVAGTLASICQQPCTDSAPCNAL